MANYPPRKLILRKLGTGPVPTGSLHRSVKMTQRVFESHLGQLKDAGLVEVGKESVSITEKGMEILSYVEKLDQENIDWT